MDDAELLRELRENCQCFQRPTFADPPCAICKAADLIERIAAIERRAKEQYHAASQADNKDPFAGRVMTELRRVLGNETPEKPGFCEDIAISAMSNTVTSQQAEIERQGKALRAVYDLCFQREQMMAGEPNPAFAAQLTTAEIRAALAERGANDKHE